MTRTRCSLRFHHRRQKRPGRNACRHSHRYCGNDRCGALAWPYAVPGPDCTAYRLSATPARHGHIGHIVYIALFAMVIVAVQVHDFDTPLYPAIATVVFIPGLLLVTAAANLRRRAAVRP